MGHFTDKALTGVKKNNNEWTKTIFASHMIKAIYSNEDKAVFQYLFDIMKLHELQGPDAELNSAWLNHTVGFWGSGIHFYDVAQH